MTEEPTSGPVVLVGGPTASGKSPLALALAEAHRGTLINADSMQVYRDLHVVTARPGPEETGRVPHRLYGILDAAAACSVTFWLAEARRAVAEARAEGRLPILVGGTGLYLSTFVAGISPIPDVPPAIRSALTARLEAEGSAALHRELEARDPETAARLPPGDRQRILRALEVVEATAEPLSSWQRRPRQGGWAGPVLQIVLDPPRPALRAACDRRFDAMMAAGALDEVRALAARGLDPALPAMRALGVPPLLEHVAGRLSRAGAVEQAKAQTRQYAKRQATWFRHQAPDALRVEDFGPAAAEPAARALARFLLTGRGSKA